MRVSQPSFHPPNHCPPIKFLDFSTPQRIPLSTRQPWRVRQCLHRGNRSRLVTRASRTQPFPEVPPASLNSDHRPLFPTSPWPTTTNQRTATQSQVKAKELIVSSWSVAGVVQGGPINSSKYCPNTGSSNLLESTVTVLSEDVFPSSSTLLHRRIS